MPCYFSLFSVNYRDSYVSQTGNTWISNRQLRDVYKSYLPLYKETYILSLYQKNILDIINL